MERNKLEFDYVNIGEEQDAKNIIKKNTWVFSIQNSIFFGFRLDHILGPPSLGLKSGSSSDFGLVWVSIPEP